MVKNNGGTFNSVTIYASDEGISVRDWYKGQIMKGLLSSLAYPKAHAANPELNWVLLAEMAGEGADALIAESGRHGKKVSS